MSQKDIASRPALKEDTVNEIEKAKEFVRQMEKDLDWTVEDSKYRLANGKFDRDMIIRVAVKNYFNK